MSDDPNAPEDKAPRSPAHRAGSQANWRHPSTWTVARRWGTGIGALAIVFAIALVALLVGAVSKTPAHKDTDSTSSTTSPTTTTVLKKTPRPGPPVCPLTGTPAPGGKVARRPALAFKIDNPAATASCGCGTSFSLD